MPQPTIIQGPAYITHNSNVYYTEGDVVIDYSVSTFNPATAAFGLLGERFLSRVVRVSFRPAGTYVAADMSKFWAWTPNSVGTSIFTGTALPLVVASLVSGQQKITFPRAGISRMPGLRLSTNATIFAGDMEFTCLGDPTVEPDNAAYWQTAASTGAPGTAFDGDTVITPRITIDFGALTGMEPDTNGVSVDVGMSTAEMMTANFGTQDVILQSVGPVVCRFAPVSLSEANYAVLMKLQNTGPLRPGDKIGSAALTLKNAGSALLTLANMGPGSGGLAFGVAAFRQREVTFHNSVVFTTPGTADAMWTFA